MFKNKEIICFLGDSLTANGLWMAEVYQHLRQKYGVKCYNCGVSGASAKNALIYLQKRCLSHKPDRVVIMFGINDIKRRLYREENIGNAAHDKTKRAAIDAHKVAYETLIRRITNTGTKVILCVPVPYDDVNDKAEPRLLCQVAMDELAVFVREMAEKYGCPLVDFKSAMQPMLATREIIGPDRVHPTPFGYHFMAQVFLTALGEQDEWALDTPFLWENWNQERFAAERELHWVNFIEYCVLVNEGNVTDREERKKLVAARYEACEDKTSLMGNAYAEYLRKIDDYDRYTDEIAKRTIF